MSSTSINVGKLRIDSDASHESLLTARPDIRIIKFNFLVPALVLVAGISLYLMPLEINRDLQFAGSILIATLGLASLSGLVVLYEALATAVYTITNEHIEEEYGIIYKRLRRIPLDSVRDVTHTQNFFQSIFGVSTVTVSPTNGHSIVLSNIAAGKRARDVIWNLVLTRNSTRSSPAR